MKSIPHIASTIFMLVSFALTAQAQDIACCQLNTSANAQFASLGTDGEFVVAHALPLETTHTAGGEAIRFTVEGGEEGRAYLVKAATPTNNYIFVIHEWWGLNDHIRREADSLAAVMGNVHVIALDLYDGKVATTRENASKYMQGVKQERAEAIIKGARVYVGKDAKVATIGWCFGGGWSLQTSLLLEEQAAGCVIYYGMPLQEAEKLKSLKSNVLGIFAEKDGWITPEVVNNFKETAEGVGKKVTIHQFDADHAFANPSSERYNKEAATKANALVLEFLKERL